MARVREAGDRVTPVTGIPTVTVLLALKPPSAVVAVMVACPAESPSTVPALLTEATAGADECQVTVLSVAFAGSTVAVSKALSPGRRRKLAGSTLTPVTGTPTRTSTVAVKPPSAVVAVTWVFPIVTPVTRPLTFTVAMFVSADCQVTALLVASAGSTLAVSCPVAPGATRSGLGVTSTPVAGTTTLRAQLPV